MKWIKKLLGLKEKEEVPQETPGCQEEQPKTTEEPQEEPIKEEKETVQEDTRPILKDRHGEDLVCNLCNNEDNETGKYFPIREGDKRSFNGDVYHTQCLRVFKKAGRKGDLF